MIGRWNGLRDLKMETSRKDNNSLVIRISIVRKTRKSDDDDDDDGPHHQTPHTQKFNIHFYSPVVDQRTTTTGMHHRLLDPPNNPWWKQKLSLRWQDEVHRKNPLHPIYLPIDSWWKWRSLMDWMDSFLGICWIDSMQWVGIDDANRKFYSLIIWMNRTCNNVKGQEWKLLYYLTSCRDVLW